MKLMLSALLLTVLPAAFAQAQASQDFYPPNVVVQNPSPAVVEAMKAEARYMNGFRTQSGCPLYLSAASVAGPAGYLPVNQRRPDDGILQLQFRNQSGKAIRSAAVTATVTVKTNIYDLDAHPIVLQLRFSGTDGVDRDLNQLTQIALPQHYYVFGLATVALDRVTYADGTTWTAPPQNNYCKVNPQGSEKIAR